MNAEIISIGDEITNGQTLDTNSQWLSRRLNEWGVEVLFHTSVADRLDANIAVFSEAIRRADMVVATGGLGPTADDLTREVLARVTGQTLVRDDEALDHIRQLFALRGRPMAPKNELQAWRPEASRMIANPHGTAPGIAMAVPRENQSPCHIITLPGVPAELKEMWYASVVDLLRELGLGHRVVVHRLIKCFGAGESQIEAMLPDLIRRDHVPRVGITASETTISLRITAEGATRRQCDAATEPTVALVRQCLGDLIFAEEEIELQDVVVRQLHNQDQTLAVAEWGTSGTLTQFLESADQTSGTVRGGIVVADRRSLGDTLGLAVTDAERGAETAGAMAAAVRTRLHADYGLSVVASAEMDASGSPKLAWVGLADQHGTHHQAIPPGGHPATRTIYQVKCSLNALRLALRTGS